MDDRRTAWLDARRQGIGGSDAAALFVGATTYGSPTRLWAEKTGRLAHTEDEIRQRWGRRFEGAILDEYEYVSGLPVVDQETALPERLHDYGDGIKMLRHPDAHVMFANLDGVVAAEDAPRVIDAKTVSRGFKQWLADGRPPLYICVQLHHYMCVTGLERATVAAFVGLESPLYVYEMERDPGFESRLMEIEDTFWRRYVVPDRQPPPDGSSVTESTLREIYPQDNGQLIQLTGPAVEWAADYEDLSNEIAVLTKQRDEAKTKIIATIADAAAAELPDGRGFTYKTDKRGRTRTLRRASEKALRKYKP